jgi:uncharacterized protein YutE (UPF0331/DUF86 family)
MNERINAKINEIQEYLRNVAEISPDNLEEYQTNWKTKAICERLCEKITEAVVDISFLIFKEELNKDKNIKIPKNDSEVFEILRDRNIISSELCKNLIELKAMRNWLAHEYGEIDDEIIFHAVSEELHKDINNFLSVVENYLKKSEEIKE